MWEQLRHFCIWCCYNRPGSSDPPDIHIVNDECWNADDTKECKATLGVFFFIMLPCMAAVALTISGVYCFVGDDSDDEKDQGQPPHPSSVWLCIMFLCSIPVFLTLAFLIADYIDYKQGSRSCCWGRGQLSTNTNRRGQLSINTEELAVRQPPPMPVNTGEWEDGPPPPIVPDIGVSH